jgi:hypothetical protein
LKQIAKSSRAHLRLDPHRLLCGVAIAFAFAASVQPTFARAQSATVVPSALERKIQLARTTGTWTVEEGDTLYRIARLFYSESPAVTAMVRALVQLNEQAFIHGDPSRLVVGTRLVLPPSISGRTPPAERAATPPAPMVAPAIGTPPAADIAPPAASAGSIAAPRGPQARPAPAAVAADPRKPAYVDRLIDERVAAEPDTEGVTLRTDTSPGLKAWAVEYRGETRDINVLGKSVAQGLVLAHRRETERYGDFALDLEYGYVDLTTGRTSARKDLNRATLYHDNFALAGNVASASALGVVRSTIPPWMASSWRINLPTSQLGGFATVIDAPGRDFRASYGNLGRLVGNVVQGFERTSGQLGSLSWSERVSADWLAGVDVIGVRGSSVVPDSNSITIAGEYGGGGTPLRFKVQGIADDSGHYGGLIDAHYRSGRLAQRFGVYQMDPGLVFGESFGQTDTRGAYWRADYRRAGTFFQVGAEFAENNLDRNPARGGTESVGGYGNFSMPIDLATQAGGGLSLRNERPRTGIGEPRRIAIVNAFVSRTSALGTSRLDALLNETVPETSSRESIRTLSWNQDWPMLAGVDTNTLLSFENDRLSDKNVYRNTASVGLRGPAFGAVRWDATFTYVNVRDPLLAEDNVNASVGIDWQPAPNWYLRLQWLRNQINPTAPDPLQPYLRENTFQLSARWEESFGVPYPRLGTLGGRSGTGRIDGAIFYDENGDGTQQATERGAANVVVILDGRRPATTDREGRFSFDLVSPGSHQLRFEVERVALPWGLADDTPRQVRVGVREDTRIEIPLSRIAP